MRGMDIIVFFSINMQKVCINVHMENMIPKYTVHDDKI